MASRIFVLSVITVTLTCLAWTPELHAAYAPYPPQPFTYGGYPAPLPSTYAVQPQPGYAARGLYLASGAADSYHATPDGKYVSQEWSTNAGYAPGQVTRILIEDFEYEPTAQGYRYRYRLPDGLTREEVGIIPNAEAASEASKDRDSADRNAIDSGEKKNRKLAAKSLASLAG